MKFKILLILFTGYFLSFEYSSAQVPKTLDSMEIYLKIKPQDSTYTKVMKDCAFQYLYKGQYARTDSLAKQLAILAKKINFPKGLFYYYLIQASIANSKSENQQSLVFFLKGLEIVEKNHLSTFWREASLNNVAVAYQALGDNGNALKYALKAIEVEEKFPITPLDGLPYNIVGNIYKEYGQYEKAQKYYENSLKISTNNHLQSPSVMMYSNNMAEGENKLGNLFDSWGKSKKAKLHYEKGLKIAEKVDYKLLQTDLLTNLGNIYNELQNYSQAENYYKRSEKLCRELESETGLRTVCINLGGMYLAQKKYALSEKYLQESLRLAQVLKHTEKIKNSYRDLSEFYATTKNFQKAYQFSEMASALKDSVFKTENEGKIQELLTKYETEKKESQIKILQKEAELQKKAAEKINLQNKATTGGSILAILLLIVTGGWLSNRNKLKQLQISQELRNKIAADLHDEIGSTLSSISLLSGITEENLRKNESEKAGKMIHRIQQDSRQVMESMDDIIWTVNPKNDSLSRIILRLKEFAMPLAESKDMKLDFQGFNMIDSTTLSMEIRRNIYLICKEAINNLLKYSKASEGIINFQIEGKSLVVKIIDNGIGFDTTSINSRNGLRNMQERAKELGAEFTLNSVQGQGTSLFLKVPII
jgi:signal transduction histidine kinase